MEKTDWMVARLIIDWGVLLVQSVFKIVYSSPGNKKELTLMLIPKQQ